MLKKPLLLVMAFASLAFAATPSTPDPKLTPGALCSPTAVGFAGYAYAEHVAHCNRVVTTTMKRTVLAGYGVPWSKRDLYEVDHLIPLCLGGANARENLWPEPWADARTKDVLEKQLCASLRAGRIKQAVAVEKLRTWHRPAVAAR